MQIKLMQYIMGEDAPSMKWEICDRKYKIMLYGVV